MDKAVYLINPRPTALGYFYNVPHWGDYFEPPPPPSDLRNYWDRLYIMNTFSRVRQFSDVDILFSHTKDFN